MTVDGDYEAVSPGDWGCGDRDELAFLLQSFDIYDFFFNKQTFSEVQSSMGSSLCLFPPMNGLHFRQQFVHIG